MMNGMVIIQNCQTYDIYTPQGIQVARIFMGADGQIIQDVLALDGITKILRKRWDISTTKSKSGR